ncbi:MAG: hypothetical protein WCW78_01120 [Candidatus Paceibacterota bacterium]|jgi:hypothetical protein
MNHREISKKILFAVVLGSMFLFAAGCARESYFRIVYANRTEDIIEAKMDGTVLGTVPAGEDKKFSVRTGILDSSPTSAEYPNVAIVNFSARNLTSQKLATKSQRTIYTDRVESVIFEKGDFQ